MPGVISRGSRRPRFLMGGGGERSCLHALECPAAQACCWQVRLQYQAHLQWPQQDRVELPSRPCRRPDNA
jgi:hypothetical protein